MANLTIDSGLGHSISAVRVAADAAAGSGVMGMRALDLVFVASPVLAKPTPLGARPTAAVH